MLTMMRNATKGWTAKILLLLLVASFAVWGVSGSMLQGVGNSVVSVGNTNVGLIEYRLAYDRQLNQLQRQFGTRLTREQANAFGLEGNVLSQLVTGALLDESANQMGLGISKDKLANLIADDDAFRDATGQFSRSQLQAVLRNIGMSEEHYVSTRQAVAVRNQIIEGTVGKVDLPQSYWDLLAKYEAEERVFDFFTVTENDIADIPAPGDEDIKAFYEANLADYEAPEFRKLNVVKLEASDIADEASVTEEDIQADYEARKASFSSPEKRAIEQLVFTDEAKAQEALDALKSGSTFEQIVENEGKTLADISLGTLEQSQIPDPKVGEAVFALDVNQASELVDGLFGKIILRVTAIEEGSTRPLEEVRDEIRKALALTNAADDIYDTHDRLEDERAAGESLETAARNVGLQVRVIEAVDRTARDPNGDIINDIPQSRELLAAAFDIDEGVEADPILIGTDGFVWYEVASVTPERQKTLEEVKDQVRNDWIAAEKAKAITALAESIRKKLVDGAEFNSVIADMLPAGEGEAPRLAQTTAAIKRDGQAIGLTPAIIANGFNIPTGDALVEANEAGDQRIVLQVKDVRSGTVSEVTDADKDQLNGLLGDDLLNQMISRMREDQTVEINQQAINAAHTY